MLLSAGAVVTWSQGGEMVGRLTVRYASRGLHRDGLRAMIVEESPAATNAVASWMGGFGGQLTWVAGPEDIDRAACRLDPDLVVVRGRAAEQLVEDISTFNRRLRAAERLVWNDADPERLVRVLTQRYVRQSGELRRLKLGCRMVGFVSDLGLERTLRLLSGLDAWVRADFEHPLEEIQLELGHGLVRVPAEREAQPEARLIARLSATRGGRFEAEMAAGVDNGDQQGVDVRAAIELAERAFSLSTYRDDEDYPTGVPRAPAPAWTLTETG